MAIDFSSLNPAGTSGNFQNFTLPNGTMIQYDPASGEFSAPSIGFSESGSTPSGAGGAATSDPNANLNWLLNTFPQLGAGPKVAPPNGVQSAANEAVLAPQAQLPVQDYVSQVTQSLQPTFTNQENALTEDLAGKGILNSGAASKSLQDLVGQQGATIAGLVAPLLAQGNAQQQQVNLTNAGAKNSMIQQGNQLSEQTGLANLGGAQALQLAQLGFANNDQNTLLNAIYGLTGGNQQAINQIASNSVGQGSQAYQGGIQTTLPYLNQAGQGAGYGPGTIGAPQTVGTDSGGGIDYSGVGYQPPVESTGGWGAVGTPGAAGGIVDYSPTQAQ